MKRKVKYLIIVTIIFLHFFAEKSHGQENISSKVYQYFEVDQLPKFTYKDKNIADYIWNKISWPQNLDIQGEVIVSYIVNENGKVEDIKIVKSLCTVCDELVKDVFKDIPDFKPGILNFNSVKVRMFFPIKFVLK